MPFTADIRLRADAGAASVLNLGADIAMIRAWLCRRGYHRFDENGHCRDCPMRDLMTWGALSAIIHERRLSR